MGACLIAKSVGIKRKLVWSNPNPAATFSPQTIELDLNSAFVIITARSSTNSTVEFLFSAIPDGSTYMIWVAYYEIYFRDTIVSSTGIQFKDSYVRSSFKGAASINNGTMVPTKVWALS